MSKYINLNGNTWDGNSISSKIRHDDKYGAFITLGWLYDAPSIDLAEHDKQIRADAINEFANALINDGKVSAMRVLKIKEQLKEN